MKGTSDRVEMCSHRFSVTFLLSENVALQFFFLLCIIGRIYVEFAGN